MKDLNYIIKDKEGKILFEKDKIGARIRMVPGGQTTLKNSLM